MEQHSTSVYAGIDTHADTHHLAVIDAHGPPPEDVQIPAAWSGYRRALTVLNRLPDATAVGVECTGSYGWRPLGSSWAPVTR